MKGSCEVCAGEGEGDSSCVCSGGYAPVLRNLTCLHLIRSYPVIIQSVMINLTRSPNALPCSESHEASARDEAVSVSRVAYMQQVITKRSGRQTLRGLGCEKY